MGINVVVSVLLCLALTVATGLPFRGSGVGVGGNGNGNPDEIGDYMEGDIEFDARNGLSDDEYKWPNGQVPYTVEGDFSK